MEVSIDDLIQALPLLEKVPVVALKKLLDERHKLDDLQENQITVIKEKYQALMLPLIARVSQIIQGEKLKEEEVQGLGDYLKPNQKYSNNLLKGKVIEGYWSSVLLNGPRFLLEQINKNDEKALESLSGIQILPAEKGSQDLSLQFLFKPNQYFKETRLVRHLRVSNGNPVCIEGDQPTWLPGQCLTHERKKVTNKATGESKIVQGKKIKSFFDIFVNWTTESPKQLSLISQIMNELGVSIVKDSISYFLGIIQDQSEESESDDYEDEEEEEEAPSKKTKL